MLGNEIKNFEMKRSKLNRINFQNQQFWSWD
jgi:hypothetical protein